MGSVAARLRCHGAPLHRGPEERPGQVDASSPFKFRLYPSRKQSEALDREVAAAQRLYNAALEQRRIAWKRCGLSLSYNAQAGDLKDLRESGACTPANYSACQDVLRRLDKAFQAFFRRIKSGGKPGFPRFKSRERYDSLTFPSYGDGSRIRAGGKLYLQGVGEIRSSSGTARSRARSRP